MASRSTPRFTVPSRRSSLMSFFFEARVFALLTSSASTQNRPRALMPSSETHRSSDTSASTVTRENLVFGAALLRAWICLSFAAPGPFSHPFHRYAPAGRTARHGTSDGGRSCQICSTSSRAYPQLVWFFNLSHVSDEALSRTQRGHCTSSCRAERSFFFGVSLARLVEPRPAFAFSEGRPTPSLWHKEAGRGCHRLRLVPAYRALHPG